MGLFGPTMAERHAEAAATIAPYGFVTDPRRARMLEHYLPFVTLISPDDYGTAAFGRVEDAEVALFEYEDHSIDGEGHTTATTRFAAAVVHPGIVGGAAIRPEYTEWSSVAAFVDAMLWVPPFTIVKAVQLLMQSSKIDRVVGHAEFDRLYVVNAVSDDVARRAITPQLRDLLPRIGFRGALELRPGVLLFSLHDAVFDASGAMRTLGHVAPLLSATARVRDYPMR